MRYRLRTLLILTATIPPILAGAWMMPYCGLTTNCGGNNAARSFVKEYAIIMTMFAEEAPNGEFSLATATAQQRRQLASGPSGWGVDRSEILICSNPLLASQANSRRVIAVCTRPFTNVPRYQFHQAPPAYAVAYSDHSTALLSAKQFAAIDCTSFVPVAQIDTLPP
jgi:hypothetical protein